MTVHRQELERICKKNIDQYFGRRARLKLTKLFRENIVEPTENICINNPNQTGFFIETEDGQNEIYLSVYGDDRLVIKRMRFAKTRHGFGTQVFHWCCDVAEERGYTFIVGEACNTDASICFVKKHGFQCESSYEHLGKTFFADCPDEEKPWLTKTGLITGDYVKHLVSESDEHVAVAQNSSL